MEISMKEPVCYYFGCWSKERGGHYLYGPGGSNMSRGALPADFPVTLSALDGALLGYQKRETEGEAALAHIGGWTIVSFWDRSGDSRHNSSSGFVVRGLLAFAEVLAIGAAIFPEIASRWTFPIRLRALSQ
jgi:hypothetical protein